MSSSGLDSPHLGTWLIDAGLCTGEMLNSALAEQKQLLSQRTYLPVGQILVKNGFLTQSRLDDMLQALQLDVLSRVDLFLGLSHNDMLDLLQKCETHCYPDGTLLIQEGEKADSYYVIVSGSVRIFRLSSEGLEVDLNVLESGEGFGEMGLFNEDYRTTHVSSIGPVHLLKIYKHDFEAFLSSHQQAATKLLKIISSRLYKSDRTVTSSVSREKTYSQLLLQAAVSSFEEIVGSGRLFERIKDQVKHLAGTDSPCFVFGEQGTEVMGAALLIHERSLRYRGPLLRFKAQNVGEITSKCSESDRREGEAKQMRALFGCQTTSDSPSLGFLTLADQGTLVIEGIESLGKNVQAQLASYLRTEKFHLFESPVERSSSVRIIGTCQHAPQTLVELGLLDQDLASLFDPQPLKIPPLRKRKKDLKKVVDHLIHVGNRRSGKSVKGLDQDAYQRIMAHNWPGNFEELETTIVRAVTLAKGEYLAAEDIFFGLKPIQGKWSINLLQFEPLKRFMQSRLYPGLFQAVTGLLFLTILLLSFWGPETGQKLALDLTWGVWEPMAVLAALLLGRFWCAVCPIRGATLFFSRRLSLKLEAPAFLRHMGPILSAAGIALIIWAEVTWDLFSSATGTAVLLLVFVGLGITSGFIFRKLVWCRHLCPLGALLGLLARCSCTEMRSNHSVCNNDCNDHPCVGRYGDTGCPMLEAPFSMQSNQDCVLCGECVKMCQESSPALNLRIPGYELGTVRYPTTVMTVLVPVLMGTQLFRGLVGLNWLNSLPVEWAVYLAGLGLCSLLAAGMVSLAAGVMFGPLVKADLKKGWLLNYALVPMLFGYELGYHLKVFLLRGGWIPPEVGGLLGLEWGTPAFFFSHGTVVAVQALFILAGSMWSTALVNKIAEHHHASGKGLTRTQRWPVAALSAVLLVMLVVQ